MQLILKNTLLKILNIEAKQQNISRSFICDINEKDNVVHYFKNSIVIDQIKYDKRTQTLIQKNIALLILACI
jgi:hypothetical protein